MKKRFTFNVDDYVAYYEHGEERGEDPSVPRPTLSHAVDESNGQTPKPSVCLERPLACAVDDDDVA